MKKRKKLSAVIIVKNEEKHIADCLASLDFTDENVIVDTGCDDKTIEIAKKKKAVVTEHKTGSYSDWRNKGLRKAKGQWILYVDADERVPKELTNEIKKVIKTRSYSAYAIPRKNIILGREMHHGGWWPDYVKRLFLKQNLIKWTGDLHEEPEFKGYMSHLKNPLLHLKHDNLTDMVEKTNKWSEIEAKLLYDAKHPKMTWWRFFRVMITELWYRLIVKKGILDGVEGIIYSIYQMWSKFVTYAKLWEMQLNINERGEK